MRAGMADVIRDAIARAHTQLCTVFHRAWRTHACPRRPGCRVSVVPGGAGGVAPTQQRRILTVYGARMRPGIPGMLVFVVVVVAVFSRTSNTMNMSTR